jgi:Mg-chelatase subunit ChlI
LEGIHGLTQSQDYFYVCPVHLKDRHFCSPIVDAEEETAKKKAEAMAREIEKVKKEYEEKQQRKKEKEKEKKDDPKDDKDKDKDDSKKTDDKKEEKERDDKVRFVLFSDLAGFFADSR